VATLQCPPPPVVNLNEGVLVVHRRESDSFGPIEIDSRKYWGAQTQRSLEHFAIGQSRFVFTRPVIKALGQVKRSAALANGELGLLPPIVVDAIVGASEEVIDGRLDAHFPLVVFQTGSGTQTNMNANEVIANRANELLGSSRGSYDPIHPNDHVNRSQSSNDVFPTVMHIAIIEEVTFQLEPAVFALKRTLDDLSHRTMDVIKVGRTHLQDAAPVAFGQEVGDWVAQIDYGWKGVARARDALHEVAIGATAVGTGLNAPADFGARVAAILSIPGPGTYRQAGNLFAALSSHHGVVDTSSALRTLASALMKMANDVRWLASGPRAGIGEIVIPENEQGSSIMPGKVNPTQAEALLMVVAQVFGNDLTVAFAGTQGNFQLNVMKPIMLHNVLESIGLLSDSCRMFDLHCASGIEPDRKVIAEHAHRSLMTVTAMVPHIGYEASAAIADYARSNDLDLRTAALALGVTAADFDTWVVPAAMVSNAQTERSDLWT
jgi:fumarate hydratase, class II